MGLRISRQVGFSRTVVQDEPAVLETDLCESCGRDCKEHEERVWILGFKVCSHCESRIMSDPNVQRRVETLEAAAAGLLEYVGLYCRVLDDQVVRDGQ